MSIPEPSKTDRNVMTIVGQALDGLFMELDDLVDEGKATQKEVIQSVRKYWSDIADEYEEWCRENDGS